MTQAVTALSIAAVGILAALCWPFVRERAAARRLHARICEDHGLGATETQWLWSLARSNDVTDPLEVFVRPSLVAARGGAVADAVHRKLFGTAIGGGA